jgi:hypothetical protein
MTFLLLFIAIIGGAIYYIADSYPKLAELGRITFAAALLAFLLTYKF